MKLVRIPKGKGKYRTIYVPTEEEKDKLRKLNLRIQEKVNNICNVNILHGFIPGKSPVTMAKQHIGFGFTLSFDLENFFDQITPKHVEKYLSKEELEHCFIEGRAYQGLPTSPAISNLAGKPIDDQFLKWVKKQKLDLGKDIVYSRYGDDISISYNDKRLTEQIKTKMKEIVTKVGFKLNEKKTKFYPAVGGYRIICGIAVGDKDIRPTRKTKRKLRAIQHKETLDGRSRWRKKAGLNEWMKLKEPSNSTASLQTKLEELEKIQLIREVKRVFDKKLNRISDKKLLEYLNQKVLQEEELQDNVYITNDPAYFIGVSDFTTGWTSCYSLNGRFQSDPVKWFSLEGCSLAVFVSDNSKQIGTLERKKMRARALVFISEKNSKYFGSIYGNQEDRQKLRDVLINNGYNPLAKWSKIRIQGTLDRNPSHIDIGRVERVSEGYKFFR